MLLVLRQALLNKVDAATFVPVLLELGHWGLVQENLFEDLLVVRAHKWLVSRQTHVSDNTKGPHVRPVITIRNLHNFRGHILR